MSSEKELKRIADSLEKVMRIYEDPSAYLQGLTQQLSSTMQGLNISAPVIPGAVPVEGGVSPGPGVAMAAVEVRLSEEEREAICKRAIGDIEEQMTEFKGFIAQSFSELPEGTLKRIGELMKKGEKFKIRRRHGCVYLDFGHGDDDFYLRI